MGEGWSDNLGELERREGREREDGRRMFKGVWNNLDFTRILNTNFQKKEKAWTNEHFGFNISKSYSKEKDWVFDIVRHNSWISIIKLHHQLHYTKLNSSNRHLNKILPVERQEGLTACDLYTQLYPFASKLPISG